MTSTTRPGALAGFTRATDDVLIGGVRNDDTRGLFAPEVYRGTLIDVSILERRVGLCVFFTLKTPERLEEPPPIPDDYDKVSSNERGGFAKDDPRSVQSAALAVPQTITIAIDPGKPAGVTMLTNGYLAPGEYNARLVVQRPPVKHVRVVYVLARGQPSPGREYVRVVENQLVQILALLYSQEELDAFIHGGPPRPHHGSGHTEQNWTSWEDIFRQMCHREYIIEARAIPTQNERVYTLYKWSNPP